MPVVAGSADYRLCPPLPRCLHQAIDHILHVLAQFIVDFTCHSRLQCGDGCRVVQKDLLYEVKSKIQFKRSKVSEVGRDVGHAKPQKYEPAIYGILPR